MADSDEIDDSLYSRQRYVLGDNAMQRMAKSNVLLVGLGGLGAEVAKNIVLAGVKCLTVQDDKITTVEDLCSQFFLREEDVGVNRARASLPRVAELNPYVTVQCCCESFLTTDLKSLEQYQCVILTEVPLDKQLDVNMFCRNQQPPICFISADVFGVFCSTFADFGDTFEVMDSNGEDPKEIFISNITKANPGVVTTIESRMHGLEDGDTATFKEINGMVELNGIHTKIKVVSPYSFTICDSTAFSDYQHDGICIQVKTPKSCTFQSLQDQLTNPSLIIPDLCKMEAPANIHIGMIALQRFKKHYNRFPAPWCQKDADIVLQLANKERTCSKFECNFDETLIKQLSLSCAGCFPPLCTALGGTVAQEALKSLTGKFTPLKQWLHFDAVEVLASNEEPQYVTKGDRYDQLRVCVGDEVLNKLSKLRLFMVGCGAIGCEMLKNYAMLGISSSSDGLITITDNDLIEKSNLNRQFLFRPQHIQQPKSSVAAASTLEINPQLHIEAQQHRVCPQTEARHYSDCFFERQDLVVNALDNVEARRYMDSRCVSNQRALLESGTMGAKGHVQVIVPHITESYTSQQDPVDEDVPYCTLKSFPATIQHCIQWARDKFESLFTQKPGLFNKFWSDNAQPQDVVERLNSGSSIDGAIQASKLLANRPSNWADCIKIARVKFEKNFDHKAKQLLYAFPVDRQLQDGTLFWQSPKRPPTPVEFDRENPIHMSFISSTARLYADIYGIKWTEANLNPEAVYTILTTVNVPLFRPSSKTIITDESVNKDEAEEENDMSDDALQNAASRILQVMQQNGAFNQLYPLSFEKDHDDNGHIEFISAASNLRAEMYGIECADRLKIKRIAGRIVPAIATTTAAVAGLVTIELVKVVKNSPLEDFKNCFLNLALPVIVFSEPGAAAKTVIKEGLSVTLWDKWEVKGSQDYTLQEFLNYFKAKYGIVATMVVHGVKMVYVPIMPGHKKRLTQPMLKLVKPPPSQTYVDLVVSFEDDNGEDVGGPPVRYHLL